MIANEFRGGCERFTRGKRPLVEGSLRLRFPANPQVNRLHNALVTRYVTEGVTVPRPDPTRPTLLTVAFPLLGTDRFRNNGYLPAASFGIGLEQ